MTKSGAMVVGILCASLEDFRSACSQLTWGDDVRVLQLTDTEHLNSVELDVLLTTKAFWTRSHAKPLNDLARAHVRNRV